MKAVCVQGNEDVRHTVITTYLAPRCPAQNLAGETEGCSYVRATASERELLCFRYSEAYAGGICDTASETRPQPKGYSVQTGKKARPDGWWTCVCRKREKKDGGEWRA